MSIPETGHPQNAVLRRLTQDELHRLQPSLTLEEVGPRYLMQEAGAPVEHVYFMELGMASVVVPLHSGAEVEVATIGIQGIVNAISVLASAPVTTRTFVQVAGSAYRMSVRQFRQSIATVPALLDATYKQIHLQYALAAQSAACNSQHEVAERLARWLLHVSDQAQTSEFYLTQEFMADMLGVRRPTVSTAAMTLQVGGAISYRRGRITVVDRAGLEAAACECYRAVRDVSDAMHML